jgi:hypothetical protein
MFLEMRVPSAAGIVKVRSDKGKVCLFLYLLKTIANSYNKILTEWLIGLKHGR